VPELAHPGIDDGIAGPATLPGGQGVAVAPPGERVEGWLRVAFGQIRDVEQQMAAEFAPAEFAEELVDIAGKLRAFGGGAREDLRADTVGCERCFNFARNGLMLRLRDLVPAN
jgi:hypothetical protein